MSDLKRIKDQIIYLIGLQTKLDWMMKVDFQVNQKCQNKIFRDFGKKLFKSILLIYDLHPTFIHSEYQIEIAKNLRNKIQNGEDIYNLENWSRILEIPVNEIINKDYFD